MNDAGENAIVIAGGANRALVAADVQAALDRTQAGDWLLLQNEINDLDAVLRAAYDRGCRVAFNVAPVDGREQDYDLDGVALLIVNEIEAAARDLGADAVVGIDLDYEVVGPDGSMMMVSVNGTAVTLG